jgi:hypothetical protein
MADLRSLSSRGRIPERVRGFVDFLAYWLGNASSVRSKRKAEKKNAKQPGREGQRSIYLQ